MLAVAHGDCAPLCRIIAASTVSGTLQLVRFGTMLPSQPILNMFLIDDCASLVMAHVQLPDSNSDVPAAQVGVFRRNLQNISRYPWP